MPDPVPVPLLNVSESIQVLAISMGLGGIVGLQREWAESNIAGIRTFPLITVLGTIAGLLFGFNQPLGITMIVICMVGVIAASMLGNYLRARPWLPPPAPNPLGSVPRKEKTGSGITTEMAILVMYAVGVYLAFGYATGHTVIAVAVTGAVVLLLYAKDLLHKFVSSLGATDVHGIMQFILLACIILPVLPNQGYGPFEVLNPRNIWLVVVLVVGISLMGYIAYRLVGERAGTVLSGLIGGMISSTATTASFARITRDQQDSNGHAARTALVAIMLASAMVFIRLFLELSATAPNYLWTIFAPLLAIGIATAILALILFVSSRDNQQSLPQQQNPTNLRAAFLFALIYAAVSLGAAYAQEHLGSRGLYAVAAISGLSDMDAITLSSGRAVTEGRMEPHQATRAIAIALISSMAMKVIICGVLGSPALLRRAVLVFALNAAAAVAVILFWPRM
ncbi:MAG TPA: MgtC/SapB family protein [Phycisphaerales bacterium]|nr:MgtC/SapB family protein [Phycisphaerales bacterium]